MVLSSRVQFPAIVRQFIPFQPLLNPIFAAHRTAKGNPKVGQGQDFERGKFDSAIFGKKSRRSRGQWAI